MGVCASIRCCTRLIILGGAIKILRCSISEASSWIHFGGDQLTKTIYKYNNYNKYNFPDRHRVISMEKNIDLHFCGWLISSAWILCMLAWREWRSVDSRCYKTFNLLQITKLSAPNTIKNPGAKFTNDLTQTKLRFCNFLI